LSGLFPRTSKVKSLDLQGIVTIGSEIPQNRMGWNLTTLFSARADASRSVRQIGAEDWRGKKNAGHVARAGVVIVG